MFFVGDLVKYFTLISKAMFGGLLLWKNRSQLQLELLSKNIQKECQFNVNAIKFGEGKAY